MVASTLYSLPFMVQPLRDAFAAAGTRMTEVAATLRAGPWDRFFTVVVPIARRGFLSAVTLTFAHTVGEFGVVLMVGGRHSLGRPGSSPSRSTTTRSPWTMPAPTCWRGGSSVASFLLLLTVYVINRRYLVVHR